MNYFRGLLVLSLLATACGGRAIEIAGNPTPTPTASPSPTVPVTGPSPVPSPACDGPGCGEQLRLLPCTAILMNGQLVEVSPDTGESRLGPKADIEAGPGLNSMGKRYNDLFVCLGTVARIDARSGDVERSEVACVAVTADTESIWVQAGFETLTSYSDWPSVKAQTALRGRARLRSARGRFARVPFPQRKARAAHRGP